MKRFNLLPPEQRVKASRDRGLMYCILGLAVLVLALGAFYLQQSNTLSNKEAELDQLNSETAVVQQQVAALRPYAEINNLRASMTETATQIYDARIPWSSIMEQVSLVIPDNVRLQTMACTVPEGMLPGSKTTTTPAANSDATTDITFNGVTYTHKDVAEFMTRLGLIPQLTNIQLASSTGATASDSSTTTVTFTVTASLRAYVTAPPATTLQTTGAAQ